ncbi:hypothetical protein [Desulfoluna sp.]|uniref:hypothetical protein n=1 Tax=Desulfoluna sp. TaxID=2045199 RepID=UPI00260E0BCF|nr:hypothetical protein [Desulfoluna sp.]
MRRLQPFMDQEIVDVEALGEFLLKEDMEDFNRDYSVWRRLPDSILKMALKKRLTLERQMLEKRGMSSHEMIHAVVAAGMRLVVLAQFYYQGSEAYRELIHELYPVQLPW